MEEGRRMFQIFAARMFQQRVLTAYREKIARERQQKLIEEIEEENRLDVQREAKKQREAQRRKDKKRQQKLAKEEERTKREVEKAAEQAAAKQAQEKRLEEQRKKKEEQRKKKEAERQAQEDERLRREADKQKRFQEERDRQAEQDRKQREAKEKETKKREETKRKEQEEREARKRELQEEKAREDEERRLRDEQGKKEKMAREAFSHAEQDTKEHPRSADKSHLQTPQDRPTIIAPSSSSTTLPNPLVPSFQQHSTFATPTVLPLPSTSHHPLAPIASQTMPTPVRSRKTSGTSMFSSPHSQHTAIDSLRISPGASSTAQSSGHTTVPSASTKGLASVPSTPVSPLSNTYRYGSPVPPRNPLTPTAPPGLSQRYHSVSQDTGLSTSNTTSTPTSQFHDQRSAETPLSGFNAIGRGHSSGGAASAYGSVRSSGRGMPSENVTNAGMPFSPYTTASPLFNSQTHHSQASQATQSPQRLRPPSYEKGSFGRSPLDTSFQNLSISRATATPNRRPASFNDNSNNSHEPSSHHPTAMPLFPPTTHKLDTDLPSLANELSSTDLLDSSTPTKSSATGLRSVSAATPSAVLPDKSASSKGGDPFSNTVPTFPNPLTGKLIIHLFFLLLLLGPQS